MHSGKRVFDDGAAIIERGFTTIGAECTLGENSVIQCHSQEDGAFKSEVVVLGRGSPSASAPSCTTAPRSAMPLSWLPTFLMKGEDVPTGERWGGNPARSMT